MQPVWVAGLRTVPPEREMDSFKVAHLFIY
jgi:hypothetical protein